MYESVHFKKLKIEFIEKYKTPSKYVLVWLDLKCDKVTSTSVPMVKCLGKYENKFSCRFCSSLPQQDLNIMCIEVVELIEHYLATINYFQIH